MVNSIDGDTFNTMKVMFNFNDPLAYSLFTYDEALCAYYCASIVHEGETLTNVTVHFNDGKVECVVYNGTGPIGEDATIIMYPRAENGVPTLPVA